MMRSFATLSVGGDIDLTGLHRSTATLPDVAVRITESIPPSDGASWEWIDDTDSHLLRAALDGPSLLMEFDINGLVHIHLDPVLGEIRVHNRGQVDADGLEHLVANQALPLYASLVGLTVLHGSAVEIAGGAVIALGDSGAGKSTFASHLMGSGGQLLTDDSAVIENTAVPPLVHPISRLVRLHDDSLDAAFERRPSTSGVGAHSEKRQVQLSPADIVTDPDPRPIHAFIELGQDTNHPPRPIPKAERLAILDRSLLGFVARDERARQRRFDQLMDLSRSIPMWEIGIKWTPAGTRRSVEQIVELITSGDVTR